MSISGGIIMFMIGLVLEYQNKYDIIGISFFMPIIIFLSLGFLFFVVKHFILSNVLFSLCDDF